MAELTYVPLKVRFPEGEPAEWHAECDRHQWAVKETSVEVVEALIREHSREHPTVHCTPPPSSKAEWQRGVAPRYKLSEFHWPDGTVSYCGQCGVCPSPGWAILHVPHPVADQMQRHWMEAHASRGEA